MSKYKASKKNVYSSGKAAFLSIIVLLFGILFIVFIMGVPIFALRSNGLIEGIEFYSSLSRDHVQIDVSYDIDPPVGGPHSPVPQNCGIYSEVIANENAVHSLEHGAVWVAYDPSLPITEINQLENLVEPYDYTLLSPYEADVLNSPIVVVAWGIRLEVEAADDPRLSRFLELYVQGPQTPEPGEPCTGGMS